MEAWPGVAKKIRMASGEMILSAHYLEKKNDAFAIRFSWTDDTVTFAELLHYAGAIPLPPYLKRKPEQSDAERYQTVYAHYEGSVAAPTAGLHFTDTIIKRLAAKNIQIDFVTLHVGAGTFKPVKTETMEQHEMHAEFFHVSKKTIEHIIQNLSGKIIAVGTTSLRTLESLYWLGVKMRNGENDLGLSQWAAYELPDSNLSAGAALEVVLEFMTKKNLEYINARTQILIAPPYRVRTADALITNFHQPESTLLLLVAAVVGDDWKKIYEHALLNEFRFLSYGDGCLLWAARQERGK